MPTLAKSLQLRDLGFFHLVAEWWGIELQTPDAESALDELIPQMLDADLLREVAEALPEEARAALEDLCQNQGRLPWALFHRRYGPLREMGPGRRDREHPDRHPVSPVEVLWYRGLVFRAFFDTPSGPEEFAYIPDDLLALLPPSHAETPSPLGRPASPAECTHPLPTNDLILDHATTLLAAWRLGLQPEELSAVVQGWDISVEFLKALLSAAGVLDEDGLPQPEATRAFLEAPRGEALASLAQTWLHSQTINDLRLIPHLQAEGAWENDPLKARQAILSFIASAEADTWWSITSLIAGVKQALPDFQRPAGDYDSWYLRDRHTGEYLRGFEHWDEVDGALIGYLIRGPLHWLGILDLAAPDPGAPATAYRYSNWAADLLRGATPRKFQLEEAKLHVRSSGQINVPRLAPRAVRYQIARFCSWESEKTDEYRYQLTPEALTRAQEQGLQVEHLLSLLRRHAKAIPPNVIRALTRWEQHGVEARFEQLMVLRLSSPQLLQKLQRSPAARFLGDALGPTAVIVNAGAWHKVLAVLVEMGYLGERGGDKKAFQA